MSHLKFRSLFLGLMCIAFAISLYAQHDRGSISGFVRDPSAAPIADVAVIISNENTGIETPAKTNSTGYYQAPNLVSGLYTVEAEMPGFKKFSAIHVKLDAASTATVDIALTVGALAESIDVIASTAAVQADTAQLGRVVESKQISDLTLNGRNPLYLTLVLPGVNGSSIDKFDPDGLGHGNLTINGGRPDENGITVDGAQAVRTRAAGGILGTLNVDTIQEVQVLTANYNAEYGRASSGQIRYITKSGGREFHGALWEYFKNDVLNANTWARNRSGDPAQAGPAPYRFNEFGYAIGGPIFIPRKFNTDRNKLFFFQSLEFTVWHRYSNSSGTVPSAGMRAGDFSELLNPANTFFGKARIINDPANGRPFPNNVIPSGRLSPNGVALLNTYPLPTPNFNVVGATNWFTTGVDLRDSRKNTFKVDYLVNDRNTLSVRGTIFEFHETEPFRGAFNLVQVQSNRPNYTSVASLTTTISPTLINEAAFTASADRNWFTVCDNGRTDRTQYHCCPN